MVVFNVLSFLILLGLCVYAYQRQPVWLRMIPYMLLKWGEHKVFLIQLLFYGIIFVGWLALCHWVDVKGLHGLAAGGMAFGMLLGLQAMRMVEEKQKDG